MTVIEDLKRRGFINNTTGELSEDKFTAYIGFDLTAPSLHVGSLIQLMVLRMLADAGHRVIALLGEATTKVGDPSGKDTSRPMLGDEDIARNREGIARAIRRIVPQAEIVSNGEWFSDEMSFVSFLRDFGPHFTINRMNNFDTVRRRLDANQPMTFLEFTYMLLQAVDFLKLSEREGCTVQIGGSDQWGNIINGVELIRRVSGKPAFGLTTVLLTDKAGKKMGKTTGGAIWLDPEMTSPFDFFQFWRNVEDEKVAEFEGLFTRTGSLACFVPQPTINARKEMLAHEITALVHGREIADQCIETARKVFVQRGAEKDIAVEDGETVAQLMARVGLADSRGAARRLMAGNGVSLDDAKIIEDQPAPRGSILRVGKKQAVNLV